MLQWKYQSHSVKQKDKYCSYTSHSVAGTVGNYTNARKIQTQPRYSSNCPTICSPCPVVNQWNMFAKCRACARAGAFCFTGTNHMAYMIHRERERVVAYILWGLFERVPCIEGCQCLSFHECWLRYLITVTQYHCLNAAQTQHIVSINVEV